jgi:hypothetical protein
LRVCGQCCAGSGPVSAHWSAHWLADQVADGYRPAVTLFRRILIWLAMAGLLAPAASGAVLCIEADGVIAIEGSHANPGCAPVCDPGTDGESSAPTCDECVDYDLVDVVAQASRTDLSLPALICPPLPIDFGAMQRPGIATRPRPASSPWMQSARCSLRATVLRI